MDPLDAIRKTYFQECDELLADLEQGLLTLENGADDEDDLVNAIFRAVHSIKGGAGAFGYEELVGYAHIFETTLDAMRSGALAITGDALKVMLRASDVLADLVSAARDGHAVDTVRVEDLQRELESLAESGVDTGVANEPEGGGEDWGFTPVRFSFDEPESDWRLEVAPLPVMYANGHDAALFIRELDRLAPSLAVTLDDSALPALEALDPEAACLRWSISLPASTPEAAIRDVFDWVGDDCPITLTRTADVQSQHGMAPEIELETAVADAVAQDAPPPPAKVDPLPASTTVASGGAAQKSDKDVGATIRVDLERVDRLIDLVGELVINQAVLAQRAAASGVARASDVAMSLDELEQLTREIQDSVMAIRAQPVKSVFQRMPRLVREIATATGKEARLVIEGEGTEVDKTVIERLSDPITHMLRNAIDHGLEAPEQRAAAGKPTEGVVRLSAQHRSGRIVIEVSDDGRGIDRQRVRQIAIDKGLIAADLSLNDDELDNLIFLPGFSTASSVSNISGRGVGMDVVKRSIQSLGGRISISSQPGLGSKFTLSLPLTLAVLDGMVVRVGQETMVAPLSSIVETLRPRVGEVRPLGPRSSVLVARGAQTPLIDVGVALGLREHGVDPTEGVTLLVESEVGGRAALVVDAIQGQRQVVIKSLEANYQRVPGVAAATILGDGRVALILDIDSIVARSVTPGDAPSLALAS